MDTNPLLVKSSLPYGLPPFNLLKPQHFDEALTLALKRETEEINAIASNPSPPTFENTLVELEKSGQLRKGVYSLLMALVNAHSSDELDILETKFVPLVTAHKDSIFLDVSLWKRVDTVFKQRESLGLDSESARLLGVVHKDFMRAGAALSPADQEELRSINKIISELETSFSQMVKNERVASSILVDTKEELAGLTEGDILGCAEAAKASGHAGKFQINIVNTTPQPIVANLKNRALRQKIMAVSQNRNISGGPNDTKAAVIKIAKLRATKAKLLGYKHWADYATETEMAQNGNNVFSLLNGIIGPAMRQAEKETVENQSKMRVDFPADKLAVQDWDYYSAKVFESQYGFNESELSNYFMLQDVVFRGLFYIADVLYGLTFTERPDLPSFHPDVRTFEVIKAGEGIGLFVFDPYARATKKGGAWMDDVQIQSKLLGQKPIIFNCLNLPKPAADQPTLLSLDWVGTSFHEFGHALHGLLANCMYPTLSGTHLCCDFVEFPSQVNEMWALHPTVLANYAHHFKTGAPIPLEYINKVTKAQQFNQGYATTAYLAAALVDQAWHVLSPEELPTEAELTKFEESTLRRYSLLIDIIPTRYHSAYFSHTFCGEYSARYYSYIWSDILSASASEFILKNGGLSREMGTRLMNCVLSRGNTANPNVLFRNFLGAEPTVDALLRKRGLLSQ